MRQARIIGLASLAAGIACCVVPVAQAQKQDQPILVGVEVTDTQGGYIKGLKPSDFRVLEDGISQKISAFAEGTKPPLLVNDDGATGPRVHAKEAGKAGIDLVGGHDLDDSYTITYYPDPSNRNEGFRKIEVQIVTNIGRCRVRHRRGYRTSR